MKFTTDRPLADPDNRGEFCRHLEGSSPCATRTQLCCPTFGATSVIPIGIHSPALRNCAQRIHCFVAVVDEEEVSSMATITNFGNNRLPSAHNAFESLSNCKPHRSTSKTNGTCRAFRELFHLPVTQSLPGNFVRAQLPFCLYPPQISSRPSAPAQSVYSGLLGGCPTSKKRYSINFPF